MQTTCVSAQLSGSLSSFNLMQTSDELLLHMLLSITSLPHLSCNLHAQLMKLANHISAGKSISTTSLWLSAGKPLSKCGKCARYMKLISARPTRLYCPSCEEVFALPQGGTIKLYKGLACPLDAYELVSFIWANRICPNPWKEAHGYINSRISSASHA